MLHIGCHLSSAKGFEAMGKEALKIGADTFQFFTRNPRGGAAKALDTEDASRLQALLETNSFAPLVAHAPYTLNPCAASEDLRQFAQQTMADDLARLENLPGNYYNFHPGSHVKQGAEAGDRPHCGSAGSSALAGVPDHGLVGDDGGQGHRGGAEL